MVAAQPRPIATDDELRPAWTTLVERGSDVIRLPKLNEERLLTKAGEYLDVIASEQAWDKRDRERRWQEIKAEVQATGTYTQTCEELAYGAQLAWRFVAIPAWLRCF